MFLIIIFISGCGVFDDSYDYLKYSSPYNPSQRYEGSYINFGGGIGSNFHPDLSHMQISVPAGIK